MRKASIGLFVLAGLLLLAAIGPPARAASTQSVAVTFTFTSVGEPQRVWTDDQGVTHIRGQPLGGTISGDFGGTWTATLNFNVDADGNGDSFGSFTASPASGGTWAGRLSGTLTANIDAGSMVGQGSGALQGTKIMGSFMDVPPDTVVMQGIILDPHG